MPKRTMEQLTESMLYLLMAYRTGPLCGIDAAEWIARQGKLEKKLYKVPEEIDDAIAVVKLAAMGIKIDTLTEAQREYLSGWQV